MRNTADNNSLLIELEEKFAEWKASAKFKPSFDELDQIFFIKDYILSSGFVSPNISRMVCARIVSTFDSWIGQVHAWMIPAPHSIISTSETQMFDEKEKEELNLILNEFRGFTVQNLVAGLTKDTKKEAEFVNQSVVLWNKYLERLILYSKRLEKHWGPDIIQK